MATHDQDYKFDEFIDGSEKLVGEQHLSKMKTFVKRYAKQIEDIEYALEESLSEVWDSQVDPLTLSVKPYEQTSLLHLIKTDNKVFNKILLVFSSLCSEIQQLKEIASQKFYGPLKLFGEIVNSEHKEASEGDTQIQFGRMLPFLLDLSKFINRTYGLTKNIVHQLASLYQSQQKLFTSFKSVHLQTVFDHLAELLSVLITLDEIIVSNNTFQNYLALYKRMSKAIKNEPGRYHVDEDRLWQVEKMLYSLKGQLLDGRIFQNCIEQEFDYPGVLEVTQNKEFRKEFFLNTKTHFAYLATKIGEQNESNQRYKFVGFCGLYVFYVTLFKDPADKKFFKSIWEMHKKIPILHLHSDVAWSLTDFLRKTIPMMVKNISNPDITAYKKDYLKQLDKDFQARVKNLYLQVSIWMVRMESNLTNRADLQNILNTRVVLLTQGLTLSYQIGNLFKETIALHLSVGAPLKTGYVRYLCDCVELLKAIQGTFHRRSAMIGESLSLMIQQISFILQKNFLPIKGKLEASGVYNKKSDAKLDALAAVTLAIQMLNGPGTKERRLILKLCMHIIFQMDFLKEEDLEEIKKQLTKLDMICDLQDQLQQSCNCAFVYWSRSMLPSFFSDIYAHPQDAQRLQYMFAALGDIIPVFNQIVHEPAKMVIDIYVKDVTDKLRTFIMDPLCRDIETDLRLHIHSHLAVSDRNPWKYGVKDLARFLKIRPIRFFDKTVNIKDYVSHYLDTTFYNLTTVALHDWKTYGEMRNLAEEKYGLSLIEPHLPGQTLEQGIDVLEIMRNIHIFVAKYSYNLNNQIFIERSSESKMLNTISIPHISNSIRTHGIGIMNTTVNFIYQFLKQKFVIFSQFLYDDHIKSRLYRDIRYFKDNKDQLDNRYPFERAQKFNKEIRNLGLTEQKLSYLDQFRNLITEIGNAMGYIRMIRSGGFHYISNAIKFVPDLQDIIAFEEFVKKENLSNETAEAAKNLDNIIDILAKNFAEGTEYFKILVSVFADEFRSNQNAHLKNFYVIVPPLTINFIEHILLGKDKLSKKKAGGFFTDDGFAMGVAYILKLLDQHRQFDSLHWFEEVSNRYAEEQKTIQVQASKQRKEDQQTVALTLKKLKTYQSEFELLRFCFHGARIFFRDANDMRPDKKENKEAAGQPDNATQQQQQQTATTTEDTSTGSNDAPPPPPPPPPVM